MKNIVFIVEGGIGKNICATGVLPGIKRKYPNFRIVVICGFPDVFHNSPNVYRCFNLGSAPYLIDDYIRDGAGEVIKYEPYLSREYVAQTGHVIDAWAKGIGVETGDPRIYLTSSEKREAKRFVESKKKPLFLIQTHGGAPGKRMYYRDIPTDVAQEVVDALKPKYDIIHFRHKEQPALKGVDGVMYRLREAFAIIPHCKGLVIDSFVQHAAAALGVKMNVVWGGTNPNCLGYPIHNNIVPKTLCPQPYCHRPNSYLFDIQNGKAWECPHDEMCWRYTADELLTLIGESNGNHSPSDTLDVYNSATTGSGRCPSEGNCGSPV